MTTDLLAAHLGVNRYGSFTLTDAVRPALDVPIRPREGYRIDVFRDRKSRLRLPMLELAEARAERLGDAGADWGRYYDARPRLICGNLAEGVAYLRGVERPAACTAPDACLAGAP